MEDGSRAKTEGGSTRKEKSRPGKRRIGSPRSKFAGARMVARRSAILYPPFSILLVTTAANSESATVSTPADETIFTMG